MNSGSAIERLILMASLVCFFVACATPQPPPAADPPARFSVVLQRQAGSPKPDFSFCEVDTCPQRSQKRLPPAPPRPPKAVSEAAPLQHAAFRVHFPIASDEFDAEAREEMVAVARSGLLTRADSILLTGRSSPSGSRDANQKLANRRALAVKAILLKAGVQESVISLNEYDCCIEEKSSSTQDMREMRRVDINITARSQ